MINVTKNTQKRNIVIDEKSRINYIYVELCETLL